MAKVKVRCKNYRQCGAIFEVEEDNVDKKLRHIQCPFCGEIKRSPFYEGED